MIQAPITKPVELLNARQIAESQNNSNKLNVNRQLEVNSVGDLVGSKITQSKDEFFEQLEANMNASEMEPTQVIADEFLKIKMPSEISQLEGLSEEVAPKVFNSELIDNVDKLVAPKSTQIENQDFPKKLLPQLDLNLEPEVSLVEDSELKFKLDQTMLKNPYLKQTAARAPSIDFTNSEIDPQLLGNEDFLAQKKLQGKKIVSNAYGMKTVSVPSQKIALESGLHPTQVINKTADSEKASLKSQEFILGLQQDNRPPAIDEQQSLSKTFNFKNINSSDSNEIMNQITDYVVQARAAKEPTVNLKLNHDELGMIDITVMKTDHHQDTIAINIATHSTDGKTFFQQNTQDLIGHLTNAGLNVSDLKVETPAQTARNDFDFGSQSGRNGQGTDKQFGSEQNQRRHDSDRRQELWKLLNGEAA